MQIFDKWVILYSSYPTEDHKLLGLPPTAVVHRSRGTADKPDLGEQLATATLTAPSEISHSELKYPLMPAQIEVKEQHFKDGKVTYTGKITFKPHGPAFKKSADTPISGQTTEDYFASWPARNYIIEKQMSRGSKGRSYSIDLQPE